MKVINHCYGTGMEMNVTINEHGKWEFHDDLEQWGKRFINGKNFWIDVAGPKKMQVDDVEMELYNDDSFSISFSPEETEMLEIARKGESIRKRIK